MSQPYKRTPLAAKRILLALKKGATRTAAAAKGGVSLDTFKRWCEEDAEFAESVVAAEGEAEASMSEVLFTAAKKGEWRASESWLKRRRSREWGDRQETTISGDAANPLVVTFADTLARTYGEEES